MPLAPRFELSQTPSEVIVTIFVPTIRVTNIEVVVEETTSTFHFHASPYLLKLHFAPYKFAENSHGNIPAEYDPSQQTVSVRLSKSEPSVEWPNLQLTARLLQPKEIPSQWLHAVADTDIDAGVATSNEEHKEDSADSPTNDAIPKNDIAGYGFAGMFQNIFTDYCRGGLAQEMLQLPDPESTTSIDRRRLRIEKEDSDFDPERYLQDLYMEEDYLYPMVMEFQPFWVREDDDGDNKPSTGSATTEMDATSSPDSDLASQFQNMNINSSKNFFTSDERLQLATIPYPLIPRHLLTFDVTSSLWSGLFDLLVAFVYDHLTTMGDPTVESAWTISTISASLSWLDPPRSTKEAMLVSTRRMLVYPYWRNWAFSLYVWKQTLSLLKSGIYAVVKSLLMTRSILEKSESYYVGNKLFVDPYLYWIQQMDGEKFPKGLISAVAEIINDFDSLKSETSFDLAEVERQLEEDSSSHGDCSDEASLSSSSSSATSSNSNSEENHDTSGGRLSDKRQATPPGDDGKGNLLDDIVGNGTSMLAVGRDDSNYGNSTDVNSNEKKGPLIEEVES